MGRSAGARILSWTVRSRSITPARRCATSSPRSLKYATVALIRPTASAWLKNLKVAHVLAGKPLSTPDRVRGRLFPEHALKASMREIVPDSETTGLDPLACDSRV